MKFQRLRGHFPTAKRRSRPPENESGPASSGNDDRAGKHIAEANHDGAHPAAYARELQDLARAVRRIGCGYRSDPESIAVAKDEIVHRLAALARRLQVAP